VRKLTGYPGLVVGVLGVAMSLYHVYARLTPAAPDGWILRMIALAFCLTLAFLLFPARAAGPRDEEGARLESGAAPTADIPWTDLGLAALSLASLGYLFVNYEYITTRFPTAHPLTPSDMVVGIVLVLLVLEATRRTLGAALPILALAFVTYGLAGPWLPGPLRHRGLTFEILVDQTVFTTEGLFGIPLGVAASYVILFIVFGAFLEKSGAGQFFMSLANGLAGAQRGGPGKVAVVSSSLFGTISGSAVANVMVDGWLTIPMMKRTGFKPEAAAAIEAVASTGGQIMPPVMGAASFVMAEFLGVPYSHVMIAAAIPAIFYYGALFAAIHFNAARTGLRGIPRAELPRLPDLLRRQGHLLLPLVVIFWLLLEGYTATYAAIIATGAVLVVSWLRADTRITLRKGLAALREGAEQTVPVAMATAAAGIMIGIILQTGLAIRFTSFLVDFAGGSLLVALVITMVAALILGTALPTTPAYIMLAALLIPALIKLGVTPLAAHMFAFYFGCLSAVTPPECLAVYAAASISRCSVWKAGGHAMKFAAAGFIVPFFFIYYPSLLFQGSWGEILLAVATGGVGVVALAGGLEGYLSRRSTALERALYLAAALCLISPALVTDAIGLGLLGAGLALERLRRADPLVAPVGSVP
jgi:TRAP transporter 4TM/12TM fusion protein